MTDGPVDELEFTALLARVASDDAAAREVLLARVNDELRRQARNLLGRSGNGTIQATELVNEAYLKLFGSRMVPWENRRHFYFAVARAMQDALTSHVRRRRAIKRGGGLVRVDLDDRVLVAVEQGEELLEAGDLLDELRAHDPQAADVAYLRVFGGLTREQIADVLGLKLAKVKREWTYGKAWMRARLDERREVD